MAPDMVARILEVALSPNLRVKFDAEYDHVVGSIPEGIANVPSRHEFAAVLVEVALDTLRGVREAKALSERLVLTPDEMRKARGDTNA